MILWNYPLEYDDLGDEAEAVIDEAFERGGVPGLAACSRASGAGRSSGAASRSCARWRSSATSSRSRDEWIANLLSVSSIAHQPDEDRDAFASRLRELIPADRVVGAPPIRTVAYWTRRV